MNDEACVGSFRARNVTAGRIALGSPDTFVRAVHIGVPP